MTLGAGFVQAPAAVDAIEWETPDDEFGRWDKLYNFTLDGAASHMNTKVRRYCTLDGTFETGLKFGTPEAHRAGLPLGISHIELPEQIDERDGLHFPWEAEVVWVNSPWGDAQHPCTAATCRKKTCERRGFHTERYIPGIAEFMEKVRDEYLRHRATIVCLLPARTGNAWFHDFVLPYATIEWHRGRIAFLDPVTKEPARNPSTDTFTAVFR